MDARSPLRLALVHDWLTGMRGGEKCLEAVCRQHPASDLYTLIHERGKVSPAIESANIHVSCLQALPRVGMYYRALLPLMPAAVESLRLPARYDLVLSLSHCVAKGVRPPRGVPHVCYCFTPMRYAWQMREQYLRAQCGLKRQALNGILALLRAWDRRTADRVTHFIAISETVRQRIRECYDRDSTVIYPPVDTDFYMPEKVRRDDYYLVVSALAPYKRLDLAIEACRKLGRYLLVIGVGPERQKLKSLAGPLVRFAGWQPNEVIRHHLQRCRALLFPGEEDFGIVPVEANACGTPVIAFARGGATETIQPLGSSISPTGVWFQHQTVDSLAEAMLLFEENAGQINALDCRQQAMRFEKLRFEQGLQRYLEQVLGRSTEARLRLAA
jgi:glycosyltransferase involved in cell wall biosynthesis